MTQFVPAALVAPSKPSLTVGYLIRALNGTVATAFTTTNVTEQGTATGYYRVSGGVAAPDAGGTLEWYVNNAGSAGAFLSAVAIEAMPDNFTAMAITSGGAVTVGTLANNAITAAVIAADAIDADAIAASAVSEIQAGLATQASVDDVTALVL